MHVEEPRGLELWIGKNRTKVISEVPVVAPLLSDVISDQVEFINRYANDKLLQAEYEHQLAEALKTLKAPDSVLREFVAYRDALQDEQARLTDADMVAVGDMFRVFTDTTNRDDVIREAAGLVENGAISHTAAAVVHGVAIMAAKPAGTPWWCFVCYAVPIWGLVCVLIKRCRGGSIEAPETRNVRG